mmetsp:Transcript_42032/g.104948  ORF Transcript_42032/g.104948 Transcript_42032/m.104948 type:complete len:201 (-) Transcript_42032:1523-2125(-)
MCWRLSVGPTRRSARRIRPYRPSTPAEPSSPPSRSHSRPHSMANPQQDLLRSLMPSGRRAEGASRASPHRHRHRALCRCLCPLSLPAYTRMSPRVCAVWGRGALWTLASSAPSARPKWPTVRHSGWSVRATRGSRSTRSGGSATPWRPPSSTSRTSSTAQRSSRQTPNWPSRRWPMLHADSRSSTTRGVKRGTRSRLGCG